MTAKLKNWRTEAAFLRKMANRCKRVMLELDEHQAEQFTGLERIVKEVEARADELAKPPQVKGRKHDNTHHVLQN